MDFPHWVLLWTHGHCHCQSGWSDLVDQVVSCLKGKFPNTAMLAVCIDFGGGSARCADPNS